MSTTRPTCQHCNLPLRRYRWRASPELNRDGKAQWGGYGDNLFCGLNCGYRWAIAMFPRRLKAVKHA